MSAQALSGEYTGIPDDLESFFHVILWHAIRYLSHNCTDVGGFMSGFFDGVRFYEGQYDCGLDKLMAMTNGVVLVRSRISRSPHRSLTFYDPISNEAHPLNDFIADILGLFKVYYSMNWDMPQPARTHNPGQIDVQGHSGGNAEVVSRNISESCSNDTDLLVSSTSNAVTHQLSDHEAMSQYFTIALSQEWPAEDKTDDQLPKNYDHDQAQKYQAKVSTKLQTTDAVDQNDVGNTNDPGPSRKRQKTIDVAQLSPSSPDQSVIPSRAVSARKSGGGRPKKSRSRKAKKT